MSLNDSLNLDLQPAPKKKKIIGLLNGKDGKK